MFEVVKNIFKDKEWLPVILLSMILIIFRQNIGILILLYFFTSLIYKFDFRYAIAAGLVLLISAAFFVEISNDFANKIAIYAYYFLVIGVILSLIDYLKKKPEEKEEIKVQIEKVTRNARFIAISSGKGGVGKTTIAGNLAVALSMLGKKVAVVDMDIAMPNLELIMGIKHPPVGLVDVIEGRLDLKRVMYIGYDGVKVIPPGIMLDGFTEENIKGIEAALQQIPSEIEITILDMPPGREAVKILNHQHEVLLVVNPEIASVLDALNMKILTEKTGARVIGAIINRAGGFPKELTINEIEKTLDVRVLSVIPEDRKVKEAFSSEQPFVYKYSNSKPSLQILKLASSLI